jgi:D-aminoacyl-tRNA deacylase
MRVVVQRVSKASVTVDERVIAEIGKGLLLFLGIEHADDTNDVSWLSSKISGLRIFNDDNGTMNVSVRDGGHELLVVSQFTLHASTRKGNRPSYIRSAPAAVSEPLYLKFIQEIKSLSNCKVVQGEFGADMSVELSNDGPVTIVIDSKIKE